MSQDQESIWEKIYAEIDRILGNDSSESRCHKFPWAKGKKRKKPTVTILPHGAKSIKMNWDLPDGDDQG